MKTNKSNLKIIAEVGSNWNGSIRIGKKIIKQLKNVGTDAVKFQMWRARDLYNSDHPNWDDIKKSEMTFRQAKEFKKFSDQIGIDCFWSVFYPEAVDCLEKLGVKYYKVASRTSALLDKNSEETMAAVAKTKKPVIISMGFGGNRMKINNIFKNNKKFWLYCISKYPTDIKEIDFKLMQRHDGFSDHTEDSVAPILYALKSKHQKKIKFLEKHVSITESSGPDKPFSMEIGDFAVLIKNIRSVSDLKIKI